MRLKEWFAELTNARLDLEVETKKVEALIKESKLLRKQNKELLSKVETAEKRGGALLLSELNEDLIAKLQELTDDNVVILFLEKDGTRIEIRQQGINYKRNNGNIF